MIKILVDSGSDIDLEEAKMSGIELIPIEIMIDGKSYLDGVNLSHTEFFKKLIASTSFPQTSQITEYRYIEKFTELTKNGDSVICICLSSKLSGTYNQAVNASKKFNNVYVVDSLNACIGERILTEYAIRLTKEDLSETQIIEKLEEKKKKIKLFAVLGTLKYLKKGGRISAITAAAGTMLNIKPLLAVVDGALKLAGKAIGFKKGTHQLNEFIKSTNGIDFDMPYTSGYSDFDTIALDKYLADSKDIWGEHAETITKNMLGSTIGTHIGTGAITIAYFEKDGNQN